MVILFLDVHIEGDRVLQKARLIADESDLKLEYDEENERLFWHKKFADGRKQDVFVSRTGQCQWKSNDPDLVSMSGLVFRQRKKNCITRNYLKIF